MSTASNIVLADAAGVPVNHTFGWSGMDPNGVSHWLDRSGGIPIGYWAIRMYQRNPVRRGNQAQATGVYRTNISFEIPVLENVTNSTVSGIAPAPTISHTARVNCEILLPEKSSDLTRQHLRKMFWNLLNNAQVLALVESLDQPR